MTPDTPAADATPSRRASRRTESAATPTGPGALTRAEYRRLAAQAAAEAAPADDVLPVASAAVAEVTQPEAPVESAPAEPSLAESVVADVAAAIVAETVAGAQPDEASRRRLRRAARAVFESVATEDASAVAVTVDAAAAVDHEADAVPAPVADQLPSDSAFVAASESCDLDEFEFAARLFSFTGEMPVQRPSTAAAEPAEPVSAAEAVVHVAARRRPRGAAIAKRMAAASFSVGVMAVVGLLAVGTTTPAAAIASASDSSNTAAQPTVVAASQKLTKSSDAGQIQAFVASGTDAPTALDRPESYNVTSMSELAAESGVRLFANTWVNDPSSPIQYPFPVGVPISAAFGSIAYLSEFATPHNGVDLTPGEGAEIHAVAAGTVRIATESGGDYGVTVLIDHIIDGQLVSTRYGHMQYGSLQVKVGDKVTAGQVIGRVGQTGKATGPHLHLEVLLGGTTRIDPMPWLAEHTKPGHTVG
ncbi:M23 family metallopeptidase [Microbacterium sp. SCN 69-37]|uniref:M23 family metallopeptidase n=1 Tax=Microbacterium sp. SCN 69-37 TaxID=1660115 RepID=UPI00086DF840|nr:M23 family metallopeptidase [Microbacterium sp. SCN 69-37]ODT23493.1 MAG: peptidase M23 [Microbacterium sp. SCN 69-37]